MKVFNNLFPKKWKVFGFGVALFFISIASEWGPVPFITYLVAVLALWAGKKIKAYLAYLDTPEYKEKCRQEKLSELRKAIELKEWIKISYDGGSQPGCVRKVLPLEISQDGVHLIATRDAKDKEGVKYRLELITIESMSAEVDFLDIENEAS